MTQTEKTEALKELREWFTLPGLNADQKARINREIAHILDIDTEYHGMNISRDDVIDSFLSDGAEIRFRDYIIGKNETNFFCLNVVTNKEEIGSSYQEFITKLKLETLNDKS